MCARVWAFVAVLSMLAGVAVAEVGFLQINAEAGIEVLLDGERVGATSEEANGLSGCCDSCGTATRRRRSRCG